MKNKKTMIVALALFALAVAALPAALAAPPDFCGEDGTNPDHPSCTSTPTTTTTEPVDAQSCATVTELRGTGNLGFDCDWTPVKMDVTEGIVTVTVTSGEVSRVVVFVRDSSPGDICVLKEWDKATGTVRTVFEAFFPLEDKEDKSETYWSIGGTNWCGPRADLNGEPLHVFVSVRAKKGTVVEVSLNPGQAPVKAAE